MREMKDSGIEWIGKIPKEWSIVKNLFGKTKGNWKILPMCIIPIRFKYVSTERCLRLRQS